MPFATTRPSSNRICRVVGILPLPTCLQIYLSIILIEECYKKPPRSPRGSRNSHINLKKRKTYTIRFYEDLTVKTNSKSPYLIQMWQFIISISIRIRNQNFLHNKRKLCENKTLLALHVVAAWGPNCRHGLPCPYPCQRKTSGLRHHHRLVALLPVSHHNSSIVQVQQQKHWAAWR